MRPWLLLALATACNSDNKLGQGQTAPGGPLASTPNTATPGTSETQPGGDTTTDPNGSTGTATGDDTATTGTGTGTTDTGLTDDERCQLAATLSGYLDPFQTPGDGHVLFCHSGGGSHYSLIDTDISSCLPHLNHANDVFPTSGCDS